MTFYDIYPSADATEPCAYVMADDPEQALVNAHGAMVDLGLTETAFAERREE